MLTAILTHFLLHFLLSERFACVGGGRRGKYLIFSYWNVQRADTGNGWVENLPFPRNGQWGKSDIIHGDLNKEISACNWDVLRAHRQAITTLCLSSENSYIYIVDDFCIALIMPSVPWPWISRSLCYFHWATAEQNLFPKSATICYVSWAETAGHFAEE